MDYLNKIITTVSTVKTSVNYALPGNIITKEYDVLNQISSAGPGLLWRVYSGSKKSTKKVSCVSLFFLLLLQLFIVFKEVSVWIFEKKCLEMIPSKRDRDAVYETLKIGIAQLTRLRHPMLLRIEHSLEESRDCLAFCTEPIFSSLANVLGLNDNLTPILADQFKNYALEQVEVQHGLSEMADALKFLHVDAKILHRNICPESVIITKSLCWKLAGFDFSTSCNVSSSDQHIFDENLDFST
uniref:Protein kinase domain-containing protein n=1 Tax=Romanomermis culicivorax TaxID=13658 RepID=A0A915IZ82_ROMCU